MTAAFCFRMRIAPVDDPGVISNHTILRREIEREVEVLISMLDEMDGDADFEPGGDDEPSLGWTTTIAHGDRTDLEADEYD